MKATDLHFTYRIKYPDSVIFMQMGNFYEVLEQDCIIINTIMGYKIKEFSGTIRVGFPINSIRKVVERLDSFKISYLILDTVDGEKKIGVKKNYKNNQYKQYISDGDQVMEANRRIDNIYRSLKSQMRNTNILQILSKIEKIV